METGLLSLAIFFTGLLMNYPLLKKPLSEDDGNWFYPAVFHDRGVRWPINHHDAYGYFSIFWLAETLYVIFKPKSFKFFYQLKQVWFALTAVAIYLTVFAFSGLHVQAAAAGFIFLIAAATPNTLFYLTYGEHFFILPISLSLLAGQMGMLFDSPAPLLFSGLASAWAFHFKPTALVFSLFHLAALHFLGAPPGFLGLYLAGFIILNIVPMIPITLQNGSIKTYYEYQFAPLVFFRDTVSARFKRKKKTVHPVHIEVNVDTGDKSEAKPETGSDETQYNYLHHLYEKSIRSQIDLIKKYTYPLVVDLKLVFLLALAGIVITFMHPTPLNVLMIALGLVFLIMQHATRNVYTPHFNPIFLPISVLAGFSVQELVSSFWSNPAPAVIVLCAVSWELVLLARKIRANYSDDDRHTFGFLGSDTAWMFRFGDATGKYIADNSEPTDTLFVWGNHPSVYLYADRLSPLGTHFFVYGKDGRLVRRESLFKSLEKSPPDILCIFNYHDREGWNVDTILHAINTPYTVKSRYSPQQGGKGIVYGPNERELEFFVLERNNELYSRRLVYSIVKQREHGRNVEALLNRLDNFKKIVPDCREADMWRTLIESESLGSRPPMEVLEEKYKNNGDLKQDPIFLKIAGNMHIENGNVKLANQLLMQAYDLDTEDHLTLFYLGELAGAYGEIGLAKQLLEQSLAFFPESVHALNQLGVLASNQGDFLQALNLFNKALGIDPNYRIVVDNLRFLREAK